MPPKVIFRSNLSKMDLVPILRACFHVFGSEGGFATFYSFVLLDCVCKRFLFYFLLMAQIFFLCGFATTYVSFFFIFFQYAFDIQI